MRFPVLSMYAALVVFTVPAGLLPQAASAASDVAAASSDADTKTDVTPAIAVTAEPIKANAAAAPAPVVVAPAAVVKGKAAAPVATPSTESPLAPKETEEQKKQRLEAAKAHQADLEKQYHEAFEKDKAERQRDLDAQMAKRRAAAHSTGTSAAPTAPAAAPIQQKQGLMDRVFGKKETAPAAVAAPVVPVAPVTPAADPVVPATDSPADDATPSEND